MKNKEIIIGGVSRKERLILVKQLYAGVKAGYPILDALKLSHSQAKGRLKQILADVIEMVDSGSYLYEAFGKYPKYFPSLFLSLIKTGEISGSLEENLKRLAGVVSKEIEFHQKIRSAMTYPVFILIAIVGLGLSISTFVLPNLLPLFKSLDTELPKSTRVLLWFAELTKDMGYMLWVWIFVIVFLAIWLFRQKFAKPILHWLVLYIPIFGLLNKKIIMARFSRALQSLLASGIALENSLKIASSIVTNYHYQKIVSESISFIRKGQNLSSYLKQYPKHFDAMFISLLALGEKTGGLEESFEYLSEFYEAEVDDSMKNLAVSLEPFLLIVAGLMVGFVAIAILGPIYSLTGSLR